MVCPAKINLFLAVGPPDAAGYHPLRTVFQTISLSDEMRISPARVDSFECDWEGMPQENTVTKAWRLAREYIDLPTIAVTLLKRIPIESGLGGGSSDAAGLLHALVRLTKGKLSHANALEIASAVGADVAFFLTGGLARATGYGEKIEPLRDLPETPVVVAKPDCGVSTVDAYKNLDQKPRVWREFVDDPLALHNDFHDVAPALSLSLVDALSGFGATAAQMTGSGSAVFGLFASDEAAHAAAAALTSRGIHAWSCRTVRSQEVPWMS